MAEYHEEPFRVGRIKDGLVPLIWPDGTRRFVALRVCRIEHARIGKALAEHDARKAEVIRLDAKRGHAART